MNDLFALAPTEIVERIVMAGYTPAMELARPDPWSQAGPVTEVHGNGLVFLVAVSREEEMLGLQEVRPDPHELGE